MTGTDIMPRAERLLVVEDDAFSQQLIELYLRKAGFSELTVASDGREALDIAKRQTFDLVLLDLNLPRISGMEVLRRLRKEGMLTETPVIISSSIANMDDIVQCLDLGADDFLPKPFNVRLLEGRVSGCLEKKRLKDEARDAVIRREREAAAARALQATLSGVSFPTGGDAPPFVAASVTLPAAEPGGDFLDAFMLPDGSALFMIGSVAESGTAAALAMARTHALVRRAVDQLLAEGGHPEPHAVLTWVNGALLGQSSGAVIPRVALLAGVVDPSGGSMRLANAGHPDPLLLDPRRGVTSATCDRGRPLGVHGDALYASQTIALPSGWTLCAYTKGLMEAADASGAPYGEHRLRNRLGDIGNIRPGAVVTAVEADLRRFIAGAPAEDVTVLALGAGSHS